MPDFRVVWNLQGSREDIGSRVWVDPPHGGLPGRINPDAARPPRYAVASILQEQELVMTLPGAPDTIPNDVDLGGRLFTVAFLESPGLPPPIAVFAGTSALQSFTPIVRGHYTVLVSRPLGGGYILHLEVE